MSLILTTDDFSTGRFKIPKNTKQTADLQVYLDRVEAEYLPQLFGVELYNLFVADYNSAPAGQPTAPRFILIFDPFLFQDDQRYLRSEGIKEMLKGFVYYLYLRDRITRVTTTGLKETKSENADNVSGTHHDLNSRFNEAVESYQAMQSYMLNVDPDDYPEFKGIVQRYNHIF